MDEARLVQTRSGTGEQPLADAGGTATGIGAALPAPPERAQRAQTPGPVITGVTPPRTIEHVFSPDLSGPRFDWYAATIDEGDSEKIARHLGHSLGIEVQPCKPVKPWGRAHALVVDGEVVARVFGYGIARDSDRSTPRLSVPNVEAASPSPIAAVSSHSDAPDVGAGLCQVVVTSTHCDRLVPVVRRLWPAHRVARADAAYDFALQFAELDRKALTFALDQGITWRLVTDSAGGATRYLGATSSEVMLRVYDKRAEVLSRTPELVDGVPDLWTRVEVQVRPGKSDQKWRLGVATPEEAFGFSRWSALFAAMHLDLEPITEATHVRRPDDVTRHFWYLGSQYAPALRRFEKEGVDRQELARRALEALGLAGVLDGQ